MATVKKTASSAAPWQVRWRDPTGTQRKKSFAKKVQADRFKTELEHQLATGLYVDAAAGRTAFREYAEKWRKAQPVRHNTRARHERELRLHILPTFGTRPIAAIRASEVQAWLTGLAQRMAPDSARVVYGTLRAIFTAAKRDRIIGHDPCDDVKIPEVHKDEVVPLNLAQVEALVEAIDPRFRGLVVLGAGAGLRQGELFGVQAADIDFMRRRELSVVRQVQVVGREGTKLVPLKSKSSRRVLPLAGSVIAELSEHLRQFRHEATPQMFCEPSGQMLHRNAFNRDWWRPARTAAADVFRRRAEKEMDPDARAELVRRADQLATCGCHDLRHYFASALIRHGLDVKTVSARLGHSSPTVTLRVYAHLWEDADDRTREAVDAAFGRAPRLNVPQVRPGDSGQSANMQVTSLVRG